MKITLISDSHNKHKKLELEGGDILIHSGDFTSIGYKHEVRDFLRWFRSTPYSYKVFICGNHEVGVQNSPEVLEEALLELTQPEDNVIYLNESSVILDGINIFGSPWSPFFYDWAFNAHRGEEIRKHWELIPSETDILVTHGPVYGILDTVLGDYKHLGCEELYKKTVEVSPLIHTCGHIHSGYGHKFFHKTNFFNASVVNEQYQVVNLPINLQIIDNQVIL